MVRSKWNFVATAILFLIPGASLAALLDTWKAETLDVGHDNGDPVVSWASGGGLTATAGGTDQPTFIKAASPAGGDVVRFNGANLMTSATSPVGGRTAFSIAIVFKASAAGAGENAQWWGKSGIVDAEQPGVTADWGTVIDQLGNVGIGTGLNDNSTYSTGAPTVVDGNFHVAVFTWGAGTQAVYVDSHPSNSQSGVSTAARNSAGFAIGGILTREANRRFNGDIAEIQFYDTALNASEAAAVISSLRDIHIVGNLPRILSFTASPDTILVGQSATLSWSVSDSSSRSINQGVGVLPSETGSLQVTPAVTTTYTLTASNAEGSRTAQVTVVVDPGAPIAQDQSVTTLQNIPVNITLTAVDPNGQPLTYAIVDPPLQGSLSGTPPQVVYTPGLDFIGNDSFTFKAADPALESSPATVSIRVNAPPAPPSAIVLSTQVIRASAVPGTRIAGLRSIDVNSEDTHTYVLVPGFGDNALFAIQGNQLVAATSFAGLIGSQFVIRLRTTDSSGLSFEQEFTLPVAEPVQGVVLNEIHYDPPDNTIREEFVELYNQTTTAVDVSNWRLSGAVDFFFPSGTVLAPGAYLVVAENPAVLLARHGVAALGPWTGALNNDGDTVTLRDLADKKVDEVDFRSQFPWPINANGEGGSMQLVNPELDNDLGSSWRALATGASGALVTPGTVNSVYALNAAPNIRQVQHAPQAPNSSSPVLVSAKVTDPEGVAAVKLLFQVVPPGAYIPSYLPLTTAQLNSLNANPSLTQPPNPAFEDPANWVEVPMVDDGTGGDVEAGDDFYTVTLPQRASRTLVRYRIVVTDFFGESRRAPFEDDGSLNFAYYVYDGIPDYEGHAAVDLSTLPIYTLISRSNDVAECAAYNGSFQLPQTIGSIANEGRFEFNWRGSMVYDGVVYDHIRYRLRGANGRYQPGKRNWRFDFNKGSYFQARDELGNLYPRKWSKLNTGKGQSNRQTLTFGLNEVVNYALWTALGVQAPRAHWFHYRVVDQAQEAPDKYNGDFWGLNWAQENYDVRFLEAHDLEKGNLYKLINSKSVGSEQKRYQAPFAPSDSSDFNNIESNLTGFQSTAWLLAHVNYENWYHYHALCEAVRNYDFWPSANKNAGWYFEPLYTAANGFRGRMWTLPWDSDSSWGPTWNSGHDVVYNGIFPSSAAGGDQGQNLELQLQYRNVVREVRDLLWQPDQIEPLIDAYAARIAALVPADLERWRDAPAAMGNYTSLSDEGPAINGLALYVADMKAFAFVGGSWPPFGGEGSVPAGGRGPRLDQLAADANIPGTPAITYVGTPGYPIDGIAFESSAFADPNGAGTFGAMEWRIAEVGPPLEPGTDPRIAPKLEWQAVWESGFLPTFQNQISVPPVAMLPGRIYRARVRHSDNTGRWSHWSAPLEFVAFPADLLGDLPTALVLTEIMYNPMPQPPSDPDDFEFLELHNIGSSVLNLSGLFFKSGIDYVFPLGTTLAPGAYLLLARNPAQLQTRYPGVVVHGTYNGKLDNNGETITLSHPIGVDLISVTYGDAAPWPAASDGLGFSLVPVDPLSQANSDSPLHWRASGLKGGSPGADDPLPSAGGVVINEALTHTDLPQLDTIEVFNPTAQPVDISGWYLTDDRTAPFKFRIPDFTVLEAGAYLAFVETQFNPSPGAPQSFNLSSLGEEVYLFSADASSNLTGYSHGFSFGAAANGVSFGRQVISTGEERFPAQRAFTPEQVNAGPLVGPVVLDEIMYHPASGGMEYLELRNITADTVSLFDPLVPANRWKINGLGFTFPPGVQLPGNGLLLVVGGDPDLFRAAHGVPPAVAVLGPFSGNLQDSGENLELQRPDTPNLDGFVPYIVVDAVRYNDRAPWGEGADGLGLSLQRLQPALFGDDPVNWTAAPPTPGGMRLEGIAPAIAVHPASQSVRAGTTLVLTVTASGPDLRYQWLYRREALPGQSGPALTLPNLNPTQAGSYRVLVYNDFGSALSDAAQIEVSQPPFILKHPQGMTINQGDSLTLTVVASGIQPLSFQWFLNGQALPGATGDSLAISGAGGDDIGDYVVVVSNDNGSVASQPAQVVVLIPPTVIYQPLTQTVVQGGSVTLSIEVQGTLPMGYRWRRSNTTIANTSENSHLSFLTLNNFQTIDAGRYTVVLTNIANFTPGVLSLGATLTLLADSDGDRLADTWESANGLNPNDPTDAGLDGDGDGLTNLEEEMAGTDPWEAASTLRLEGIAVQGMVLLEFQARSNKTYTVQYKDALSDPHWTKLTDVAARPVHTTLQISDPSPSPSRYYLLVTPRQP